LSSFSFAGFLALWGIRVFGFSREPKALGDFTSFHVSVDISPPGSKSSKTTLLGYRSKPSFFRASGKLSLGGEVSGWPCPLPFFVSTGLRAMLESEDEIAAVNEIFEGIRT